jgi:hypothetical protein
VVFAHVQTRDSLVADEEHVWNFAGGYAMVRNLLCGVVLLTFCGLVAAEGYSCHVMKVDGDKVTVQKFKSSPFKQPKPEGDPIVLKASKDVKVLKLILNFTDPKSPDPTPIDGGLKNARFTKIGETGLPAQVTVTGTTLTELILIEYPVIEKKKKD